jgi:SAM-dependent methyltransferase
MDDIVSLQKTLYESKNPVRRWLHTSRRDAVLEAVRTAPVPGKRRALEVGPGSGVYLPALCRQFAAVTAIDVEPAHINALRGLPAAHPNLELRVTDLCMTEWKERFDLVLCSEVIEHVEDPPSFMTGLANAVADDGILVLSTPQPWSFMELTASIALSPMVIWLPKLIYREPVLPTGHISVRSRKQIGGLLEANGLGILQSQYLGLYMPLLSEFGGSAAVSMLKGLERTVQSIGPTGILWTQLHVAKKRRG